MATNRNLVYFILSIVYCMFLYLMYARNGIITHNEAAKYILAAEELSNGNIGYAFSHHLFYFSYIFFITIFTYAGGVNTVIVAQACLTFYSAICLKKTIFLLTEKEWVAYTGMLLFLTSYPIQIWVLTLFSDSFFVALISIALFYTVKHKSKTELFIWAFVIILLVFARPPGIFLSTVFFLYYLFQNSLLKKSQLLATTGILFLLIFIFLFYIPVGTKDYIKPIAAGAIIVNQPDYDIPHFNSIDKSNIVAAYLYLNDEHGAFFILKLYLRKLFSFFTLTRPYYSNLHNTVMTLHYPLYILSIIGLFLLKHKPLRTLLFFSIVLLANLTAITYNEWHYRFTIAIFPFLIILSSISLAHLSDFKKKVHPLN